MRIIILSIFLISTFHASMAQKNKSNQYESRWKLVEQAFSKGLNETAEKEVTQILKIAKADKNLEQTIKALCNYRVSLRDRDEKARLNDILYFERELKESSAPTTHIIHSILGKLYWSYYQENRWKVLDRTKIVNDDTKKKQDNPDTQASDIETWSADAFYEKASFHFQASLLDAEKLKNYPSQQLTLILEGERNTSALRPTLYDILVNEAIEYFSNEENEITKPDYAFEINDESVFANAKKFSKANFITQDTFAQKFQVVKLYQNLLEFHVSDVNPDALIDADIARLKYMFSHSISINKNDLYFKALENIANQYPANKQAHMASVLLAESYMQGIQVRGNGRKATFKQDDKNDYVGSKRILYEVIAKYPNVEETTAPSEAFERASALMQQIDMKSLKLQIEKVVLPNQASLARIDYKNITTLYFKIVKTTNKIILDKVNDYNYDYADILNLEGVKNWSLDLIDFQDFKEHSTEIKIDALPIGTYFLIASESQTFDKVKHNHVNVLRVSNLAYIETVNPKKNGTDVYIVHRESGKPLSNVKIRTYRNAYDYETRKNKIKEDANYVSDKNGKAKITLKNPNENGFGIELSQGDDQLMLHDYLYIHQTQTYYQDYTRTFLFTDRSIYRPGQTIYFKGIVVKSKGTTDINHELLINFKTAITLKDANYQDVETISITTNEFGSYSGSFKAPEGLLNGQFQLVAEGSQAFISVEEYKRPKFEVTFDTLQKTYQLQDEITMKGKAKAYAGNSIDGAKVKYRVVRNARFPYYWCFYRWGQPTSPSMEITHGEAITSVDGFFEVKFKAVPDESISKETKPVFDYTIYADITDLNGETRSGQSNVAVSYQSLLVNIDIPSQLDANTLKQLKIRTTNLNQAFVASPVTLSLKQLKSPLNTYRSRLWSKVDSMLIKEMDFRKDFPLDEYQNENDYQNWKAEKTIWSMQITSTQEGIVNLQQYGKLNGWYVIEAISKDNNGEDVIDKKFVRISDYNSPQAISNDHLLLTQIKTSAGPGETAKLDIASIYEEVNLLYARSFNKFKKIPNAIEGEVLRELSITWLPIRRSHRLDYSINEADRGGFTVKGIFVKNNREYSFEENIEVPWTNKELKITTEIFRDKMYPGSEQDWKLRISGSKKDIVSAEILATMYDASLDAFKPHDFSTMNLFGSQSHIANFNTSSNFSYEQGRQLFYGTYKAILPFDKSYASLNSFGLLHQFGMHYSRMQGAYALDEAESTVKYAAAPSMKTLSASREGAKAKHEDLKQTEVDAQAGGAETDGRANNNGGANSEKAKAEVVNPLRTNFSETAFWFPQLHTDANGDVILKFKAPESLTRWKLLAYGHSKDLQEAIFNATSITQKELMIVPNTPRFLREGDNMVYSAKVTNLSDKDLEGSVEMEIVNAITSESETLNFGITSSNMLKSISIKKGQSQNVHWLLTIPTSFTVPVHIKTIARAGSFSDAEQNTIPVLSNSMLVTETMPLPVRMNTTKKFKFTNLLNSSLSNTLKHHSLTVEYTSNPAWYAVQALPYLTEYPYECAEQTFNRYYANALATHMANSYPKIQEIFSTWKEKDTNALLSNLEKNQALKSALLQETPWVLEAKSEHEQKINIALLFNMNRMSKELERTIRELEIMQTSNGGFAWFKGMPDDRFITQYILTGLGRLQKMSVHTKGADNRILRMIEKGLVYLDKRIQEDYEELKKNKVDLKIFEPSYYQVQYLYMRSFFKSSTISNKIAFEYFKTQTAKYWVNNNRMMQGMAAIALHRDGDKLTSTSILKSLRENSIYNEEMGRYWKENIASYWWYEAPVETHSLLIEAFSEIDLKLNEVDEMKIWLLKNKQTQDWKTTKATADAVYALLLQGTNWLGNKPEVEIKLGSTQILSKEMKQEAGMGYFKTAVPTASIHAEKGNIEVSVKGDNKGGTTWGAVYWQYFEDLDKIKSAATPLSIKKLLFLEINTSKGKALMPLKNGADVQVGDKVMVRIELRVDRNMEYVHMKDMRAACFEPLNVLSNYKYQGGLGYYESTKDASINFFFHQLQKGTYLFEYPMFITNKGDFSNGICTIQCMYAPEFSSHSEGIRVEVNK